MALVKCPSCGQQVSGAAVNCGYCGANMPQDAPKPPEKESADEDGLTTAATFRREPTSSGSSRLLIGILCVASVLLVVGIIAKTYLPQTSLNDQTASLSTDSDVQPSAVEAPEPKERRVQDVLDDTGITSPSPVKKVVKPVKEVVKKAIEETVTEVENHVVAAKEKIEENQPVDEESKAEILRLLQAKLAAAQERKAKTEEAQAALDAAAEHTSDMGKAYRKSRAQIATAKGMLIKAERASRRATKYSASAKERADRTNANNGATATLKQIATQRANAAEAAAQAAAQKVEEAKTALANAKTASSAAKKTYEEAKAQEKAAEAALDLVSEKKFTGSISKIVSDKLLLLRQQRGGELLHIVDGEEIRKPIETYNIALMMSTEGVGQGETIKVIAVSAGAWLPEGQTNKALALRKYEVVDRLE